MSVIEIAVTYRPPYTGNDINNYLIQYPVDHELVVSESTNSEIHTTGFARDLYDDINSKAMRC